MVPFVTKNGTFKCINKGCMKEFLESENADDRCHYHPGAPIFHDCKKSWTCCKGEAWDWDQFMKLPTCTVGRCVPKMVKKT